MTGLVTVAARRRSRPPQQNDNKNLKEENWKMTNWKMRSQKIKSRSLDLKRWKQKLNKEEQEQGLKLKQLLKLKHSLEDLEGRSFQCKRVDIS